MHAPQFGSAAATTSSGATASTAGFNLPHMVLHMPHLPHLPHLTQMKQQIKDVEVFENGITYLVYLTAPVNVAMLCVGFAHRNDCPADVRLPRYLFFGGLAGVMAALLRIIMEAKWRRSMNVNTQQQGIK